jgi:hypothetical protein
VRGESARRLCRDWGLRAFSAPPQSPSDPQTGRQGVHGLIRPCLTSFTSAEALTRRVLFAVRSARTVVTRMPLPTNRLFVLLIGKLNSIAPTMDTSRFWHGI